MIGFSKHLAFLWFKDTPFESKRYNSQCFPFGILKIQNMFSFHNYPSKLEKKGTENCDSETKIPHTKPCNSTAPSIFIYILCNRSIAKKFGFIWFQNKALHKNYMMGNFAPLSSYFWHKMTDRCPQDFPALTVVCMTHIRV